MYFVIPGTPVAKGRPRMGRYGTYTPKKTVEYENLVRLSFMEADGKQQEGYLCANIKLYFPIPKSQSKKKKMLMQQGEIRPDKKPDCDNCIKSILDSINGIAYADDSQVIKVVCEKFYSDNPRAEVEIEKIIQNS